MSCQIFRAITKQPDMNKLMEERFIWAPGFTHNLSVLLILHLWWDRTLWRWEHMAEAIHLWRREERKKDAPGQDKSLETLLW